MKKPTDLQRSALEMLVQRGNDPLNGYPVQTRRSLLVSKWATKIHAHGNTFIITTAGRRALSGAIARDNKAVRRGR